MQSTSMGKALLSGAAGACALTLLHETAKRRIEEAPRADVLGMRALAKVLHMGGKQPPENERLFRWALVGDLLSNTLYYSAVGNGDSKLVWLRGALLGLSAGVGAVALPGRIGLGDAPSNRTRATQVMTVLWYLVGGLAAAATSRALSSKDE